MTRSTNIPDEFVFLFCSNCNDILSGLIDTDKAVCLNCKRKFELKDTDGLAGFGL
ncbi:MAG: hypothetical protein OER82_09430 [Nitrosopumilus sp.]|nr:hypothetical protein [Nitrosopumilus sp.]